MDAPEVRVNEEGLVVVRNRDSKYWPWNGIDGGQYSDETVADWTPLVPAPSKDGAS